MKMYFMLLLCLSLLCAFILGIAVSADAPTIVRVGIYENGPKIFTDEKGNASGFWPDIIKYIASQEGWKVEYIHGTWDQCLQRLQNNEIDIMPDVAYTEERDKLYDFSKETVYTSWSMVYTKKGTDISTIPDFNGKNIAVLKGSVNVEGPNGIKELVSSFGIQCTFIEVDSYLRVFELVANGEADGGVVSKDFGHLHENDFNLEKTSIIFQPSLLYFAFPKDSSLKPYLIDRVDYYVRQLKGDGNSIYYQSLEKWFGAAPIEKDVTPEWIKWMLISIGGLAFLLIGGTFILRSQVKSKTKDLTEEIAERKRSEEELRKSEEKLRIMFQTVGEGVTVTDLEGHILEMNDTAVHIRGYRNKEELVGRSSLEILSPEDHARAMNNLNKTLTEGQSGLTEYTGLRKDGTKIYIETNSALMRNASGDPSGIVTITRDITERKRAEEELKSKDELLNNIIEQTPCALWISNEKGTAIRMNQALRDLLNITDEEIIGKYSVLEDRQVIEQGFAPLVKSVFEEGKAVNFTIDYDTEKEKQVKLSQTTHKVLDLVISAIKNSEGKVTNAICQHKDITEQEMAKAALRESEMRYRTLFETTGAATILVEEDKTVSLMNKELERVSGYSKKEVEGIKKWTDFVLERDLERLTEYHRLRRTDSEVVPRQYECHLVDKWGNIKTFLMTVDVIPGTKKSIASFVDITERKRSEEELRKSEDKLRIMFQAVGEGITVTDSEGRILDMNDTAVRLRGYSSKAELVGRSYFETISPEDHIRVMNNLNKTLTEGQSGIAEYTVLKKDGTKIYVETNSALMRNASGNPVGIINVTRDITQRKKAEEALKQSESSKSKLLEKLNEAQYIAMIGSWDWNLQTNQVWWSDETYRIFGVTQQDFIPSFEANAKFIHPDDLAKYQESFEHSFQTGEPLDFDVRLVTNDGLLKHCNARGKIVHDDFAKPIRFTGTVTDITERKRAQEALRQSEEKLRVMFQSMADCVVLTDLQGNIMEVNEATVRMYGGSDRAELIGKRGFEYILPKDLTRSEEDFERILREGYVGTREYTFFRKDGTKYPGETSLAVLRDISGNPVAVVGIVRDITERKKAEEALRQSEEKYRTLFETMMQGAVYQNAEGQIISANPAAERILGLTLDQMLGRMSVDPRWRAIHDDGSDYPGDTHPSMISLRTGKEVKDVVMGLFHPLTNEHVWVNINAVPLFKPGETKPYQVYATFNDITECKRAEDELRQSEEKLAKVFRSMPDFVSITSMVDGRFIDVNDSFLRIMGYTHEEVIGHKVLELGLYANPEDRDRLISIVKEKKRAGNVEIDFRTKSGEIRKGLFSAELIDLFGEICVITVVQDITERKQAEEALRQSEEKLRAMFESATDGITVVDIEGKVLETNEAAVRMYGGSNKEEVIGTDGLKSISIKDVNKFTEDFSKILKEGHIETREYTMLRKDGTEYPGELNVSLLRDTSGNPVAAVSFARDITERKKAEEALRQSEEKLRVMFQSMAEGVVLTDIQGNIMEVNEATVRMYGCSNKDDLIGKNGFVYISPKDLARSEADFERMLREGYVGAIEYTLLRKDGTEYPGESSIALLRDTSGNSVAVVSITRDITERKKAEEALYRSELKYRQLVELAQEGIWAIDAESKTMFANPKMAQMLGYTVEEMQGSSLFSFMDEQGISISKDLIERRRAGITEEHDFEFIRKDGTRLYARLGTGPITDEKGNYSGSLAVVVDVTQRRQAEEALRQSEEKLRVIFQSVPESIVITDLKGNILEANEAAARQGGYNKGELIGRKIFDFALPAVQENIKELSKKLNIVGRLDLQENICLRKDGTQFPIEVNTSQLKDASGNPAGYIIVTRDITERRRAEELIRRSYDTQSVVNHILDLALQEASLEELLRRTLGIVLSVSWLSLELGGSIFLVEDKPGVLVMKTQIGLSVLMQKECALVPFGRCICGQAALTQEIQFADYLDECHEIEYEGIVPHGHYCVPIMGGGKLFGVMNLYLREGQQRNPENEDFLLAVADVVANIISHRQMEKKVAEYQELTRLKTNILSTVSHELRTPLASIKGYATMLMDYDKRLRGGEKRQCLEAIDRATDRLIDLIDHLLDMSRLEAGIFRLTREPSNINKLIRETVAEAQLRSPEFKMRAELEAELPTLNVDNKRIRQVLDNLLENAIRYSNKGTKVVVLARLGANDVEVSVSDQGRGIPAVDVEKVFDPMYRLEQRLGQDPRGLGLGLPLCKALVEAHGGRISIESALGTGTTVHFTLPLAECGGSIAANI